MDPTEPTLTLQPYLYYEGRCEEAIDFYKDALGAEVVMLMRYKDNPEPQPGAGEGEMANRIMHAEIKIGGASLLLSDGRCAKPASFDGFYLTLGVPTESEAERYYSALQETGEVVMPLTKTFFSPNFGMVLDKFGVGWIILTRQ